MSKYHPLTTEEAISLTRSIPGHFPVDARLDCQEIGDGNLNLVFHITEESGSHKGIIIKQALPYAKVVGESWPLSLDRARIEREALQLQYSLCPRLVPEVYAFDDNLAVTVMEDLSDYTIMRRGLIVGEAYPVFAGHISEFLARTLFYTSDLAMNPQDKKEQVKQFINPDLCKITEDLIFRDPYKLSDNNNYPCLILKMKPKTFAAMPPYISKSRCCAKPSLPGRRRLCTATYIQAVSSSRRSRPK